MNAQNQFPAISDKAIAGQIVKTVDGREVHRYLGAKRDYTTWMKDRIAKYGFVENVDYVVVSHSPISGSGNRGAKDEYFLTMGMGKEPRHGGQIGQGSRNQEILSLDRRTLDRAATADDGGGDHSPKRAGACDIRAPTG